MLDANLNNMEDKEEDLSLEQGVGVDDSVVKADEGDVNTGNFTETVEPEVQSASDNHNTEQMPSDNISPDNNTQSDFTVNTADNQAYMDLQRDVARQKRFSTWLGIVIGLIGGMVLTSIIFVTFFGFRSTQRVGVDYSSRRSEKSNKTEDNQGVEEYTLDTEKISDKIESLQKVIDKNYLFDENLVDVEEGIYKGFLQGLGDPYSVYYTEEDYQSLMEETSGVYSGIGAMVNQNVNTGAVTIFKVFAGSPAEEAGLKADDILYKVGETEVTGMELDLIVGTYIRGEEGSEVQITVLRGEKMDEMTFTVTRRAIEVPTVEHKMYDGNIGYIAVNQFDDRTFEQFVDKVEELKGQGASKMVIDMRDNPGGLLDSVVDMLDYMLPKGLLLYTKDKNGKGDEFYSDDSSQELDIVVLVNENSASAAEVFTGAIKDFKYGTVIGTKTFGKGIVQTIVPLRDGSAVKITTQNYYTPSGYDLHKKGIEPDEVVELGEGAVKGEESDNQLNRALDILGTR